MSPALGPEERGTASGLPVSSGGRERRRREALVGRAARADAPGTVVIGRPLEPRPDEPLALLDHAAQTCGCHQSGKTTRLAGMRAMLLLLVLLVVTSCGGSASTPDPGGFRTLVERINARQLNTQIDAYNGSVRERDYGVIAPDGFRLMDEIDAELKWLEDNDSSFCWFALHRHYRESLEAARKGIAEAVLFTSSKNPDRAEAAERGLAESIDKVGEMYGAASVSREECGAPDATLSLGD
jgi:hypothetical protein